MVDPALLQQVVNLSPDERRELFEAAQEMLDPALATLIDEREAAAKAAPGEGRDWSAFRTELKEQYGA